MLIEMHISDIRWAIRHVTFFEREGMSVDNLPGQKNNVISILGEKKFKHQTQLWSLCHFKWPAEEKVTVKPKIFFIYLRTEVRGDFNIHRTKYF